MNIEKFVFYKKVYTDADGFEYYRILVNKPLTCDMFVIPLPPNTNNEELLKKITDEWNSQMIETFQRFLKEKHGFKYRTHGLILKAKAEELYDLYKDDFNNRPLPIDLISQTTGKKYTEEDYDAILTQSLNTINYAMNKPIKFNVYE